MNATARARCRSLAIPIRRISARRRTSNGILDNADGHAPLRLSTNAFSKKVDNHIHALSLYFVFYNFVRTHKAHKLSPAMSAGVTDKPWSIEDIDALIEARTKKPGRRGPYKKQAL